MRMSDTDVAICSDVGMITFVVTCGGDVRQLVGLYIHVHDDGIDNRLIYVLYDRRAAQHLFYVAVDNPTCTL